MKRLALIVPILLALVAVLLPAQLGHAEERICFSEVPNCIEGRFAQYWRENGGLPVFGYPISTASNQQVGGTAYLVQHFERNRFELHPENKAPYDVLLGRLGDDVLKARGRSWEGLPKAGATSQAGCQYFDTTQHLVCGDFWNYWSSHGLSLDGKKGYSAAESLALFGLPLSEATVETGSDGKPYMTQWFERARFELHPEVGPNAVLLGLLGNETMQGSGMQPTPVAGQPTAVPGVNPQSCDGVPDPVNATIRPGKCFRQGERVSVDITGFKANENVGFWFNLPDGTPFGGSDQKINIGETGSLQDVPFPLSIFPPTEGQNISIVFHGTESGHEAVIYFRITGKLELPVGAILPPSQSATVLPAIAQRGTMVYIFGEGFAAHEQVGYYVTTPDGLVVGATGHAEASDDGKATAFDYIPVNLDPGLYSFTLEGVSSHHKAIGYIYIVP